MGGKAGEAKDIRSARMLACCKLRRTQATHPQRVDECSDWVARQRE